MGEFYKVQEFAKKAGVTERTLRYYDKIELLTPSYKNEAMHRFYTEDDFKRLQKISALKFLGFSIAEIKEYDLESKDKTEEIIENQKKVIDLKIKYLNIIRETLDVVDENIKSSDKVDWNILVEEIKNVRISKHKDGTPMEKRGERFVTNHKRMMVLLEQFTKAKKESEKIEIIKNIEKSVNMMEDVENGLDNLIKALEEVEIIPEELRGVTPKDIEKLLDYINKYKYLK